MVCVFFAICAVFRNRNHFAPLAPNRQNFIRLSHNRKIANLLHISKTGPFYIRLDAFNCILIHCDRRRYSRARGLQAFPRPLIIRPFLGAFHPFHVSFFYFCSAALCCSAWQQHSALLQPTGPAARVGAGRHGAAGHFVTRCVCDTSRL